MKEELKEILKEVVENSLKKMAEEKKEDEVKASILSTHATKELSDKEKGIFAARVIRAVAAAKNDPERALNFAKRAYDDALGQRVTDYFKKAVTAGNFESAGFLLQPEFSQDIIDLLRPASVVRSAGPQTINMPRGTLTLPKATGDVSAYYIAESEDIPTSAPTGGHITLSAKKLAAMVPISNDLLRYDAGNQADVFVRDSIVRRIAIREDLAFLRGNGANNTPKGMRYIAPAGNVINSTGNTAAALEADIFNMLIQLQSKNVPMTRLAFFMSPKSKYNLAKLRDASSGELIFPEIRSANPTLMNIPVFVTTNIPDNLNNNETEIILADMDQLVLAEVASLEISASDSASYVEGGNVKSAFSRDETIIRAVTEHDFAALHEEAVAVLTGLAW